MYGPRTDSNTSPELRAAVTPRTQADRPVGEWNHFEITVRGTTVSVALTSKTVLPGAMIPDPPLRGRFALQPHGGERDGQWFVSTSLMQFKNIYIVVNHVAANESSDAAGKGREESLVDLLVGGFVRVWYPSDAIPEAQRKKWQFRLLAYLDLVDKPLYHRRCPSQVKLRALLVHPTTLPVSAMQLAHPHRRPVERGVSLKPKVIFESSHETNPPTHPAPMSLCATQNELVHARSGLEDEREPRTLRYERRAFVETPIAASADTDTSKAARARLTAVLAELNPAAGKTDGAGAGGEAKSAAPPAKKTRNKK